VIRGPVRFRWSDRQVNWTIWESSLHEIQLVNEVREVTFPVLPGSDWWKNPWGITVPKTIIQRAERIADTTRPSL
jgi:hypothetical protein